MRMAAQRVRPPPATASSEDSRVFTNPLVLAVPGDLPPDFISYASPQVLTIHSFALLGFNATRLPPLRVRPSGAGHRRDCHPQASSTRGLGYLRRRFTMGNPKSLLLQGLYSTDFLSRALSTAPGHPGASTILVAAI
jgi:hypothetical protein